MHQRLRNLFLLLVFVQGIHSTEEYIGKLWLNFPPARMLCGLVSDDLEFGFIVINIGLFIFGMSVWFFNKSFETSFAKALLFFWIIIEIINGIGHPVRSLLEGSYTPGVLTAPFLLIIALLLLNAYISKNVDVGETHH